MCVLLVSPGCRIRRKKVPGAEAPLPLPEAQVQREKKAPVPAAKELPPPPKIQPAAPAPGSAPVTEAVGLPAPPPKRKPAHPRSRPASAAGEPASRPEASAPEPAVLPKLTQLLTDEERWAYSKEIDDGLVRINEILKKVEGRPLTENQTLLLNRVRAFLRQVAETRKTDLVTARGLLERAELLAADLERTTH